jgi:hypothetical protein
MLPQNSLFTPHVATQVAQACGRSSTMCEDLYATHKAFLDTINSGNADAMWQYFKSGASSVLVPAGTAAPTPRACNSSGLAPAVEPGVNSPAMNPTGGRKNSARKPGNRTPVVPTVEPPAGKQGAKRNTPRRSVNDMTVLSSLSCLQHTLLPVLGCCSAAIHAIFMPTSNMVLPSVCARHS